MITERTKTQKNSSIYLLCIVISCSIFTLDLSMPLGIAGGVPYITSVLVSLRISDSRFTIWLAVFCSLLTIIGYFFSPSGGELWKVLFNRALALFAIWVTTILALQQKQLEEKRLIAIREKEAALNDVKVLKGLLPICASCKSIRDDDGYWKQLEGYMQGHAEIEFSHSICPECTKRLYPAVADKLKTKSN